MKRLLIMFILLVGVLSLGVNAAFSDQNENCLVGYDVIVDDQYGLPYGFDGELLLSMECLDSGDVKVNFFSEDGNILMGQIAPFYNRIVNGSYRGKWVRFEFGKQGRVQDSSYGKNLSLVIKKEDIFHGSYILADIIYAVRGENGYATFKRGCSGQRNCIDNTYKNENGIDKEKDWTGLYFILGEVPEKIEAPQLEFKMEFARSHSSSNSNTNTKKVEAPEKTTAPTASDNTKLTSAHSSKIITDENDACKVEYTNEILRNSAAPYDVFNGKPFFKLECQDNGDVKVTFDDSDDTYVYKVARVFGKDKKWEQTEFKASGSADFLRRGNYMNSASFTINKNDLKKDNQLIGYTCKIIDGDWNCGCSDSECVNENNRWKWSKLKFKYYSKSEVDTTAVQDTTNDNTVQTTSRPVRNKYSDENELCRVEFNRRVLKRFATPFDTSSNEMLFDAKCTNLGDVKFTIGTSDGENYVLKGGRLWGTNGWSRFNYDKISSDNKFGRNYYSSAETVVSKDLLNTERNFILGYFCKEDENGKALCGCKDGVCNEFWSGLFFTYENKARINSNLN